jgi:hypothetical protein
MDDSPNKGGRPSSYKPEFAKQAEKLCKLGATDADLADFFEVNTSTIWRWSGQHEEFCNALKGGKEAADEKVERSLYQRAIGFEHDAVKIMQYEGQPVVVPYREKVAPDTTACIFWLKNRRRDQWRDRQDVEHSGSLKVDGAVDRPPAETREEWLERRKRELAANTAVGSAAGSANGRHHS